MGVKVTNNGFGTLSAGINSSATTVTVDSGQGARFPTLASGDFFFATLIDTSNNLEIIKVTARSTDSMTVLRAQDNTTARSFSIGDRIELRPTAALFENAHLDNTPTSTGSFGLPKGTTAQQPTANTTEGHIRYDTDDNVVYYSNGTNWLKIAAAQPTLTGITGTIFAGVGTTLTLAGTNFLTSGLVVNFTQSSDSINTNVTVTPSSDTAATVAVPAAVYNNVTAGNVVSIKVTNSDGVTSPVQTTTALAAPSGGSITTSGSFRIHTFNSSGTFGNTIANNSVEYLIVGGGGGGGAQTGGGGGAGGMRTGSSTLSVQNYTITVGGGGAKAGPGSSPAGASSGTDSSFNSLTSTGGGGGGSYQGNVINNESTGKNGGSGGGGAALDAQGAPAGSGTSGQGNNGGAGRSGSGTYFGGGGGGAGAVGEGGKTAAQGVHAGGNGSASSITGSSVTYAGGGGGCGEGSITPGSGGSGGGGNGSNDVQAGQDGGDNKGGGGGGCRDFGTTGGGAGNGGSGVVIIRYQL